MATVTHSGTLPDSADKADFYSIIDNAAVTAIVNADLAAGAAVTDTKLAQITTAGKVSGAAITSLTSVPAGAGALPIANGGTAATTAQAGINALAGAVTANRVLRADGSNIGLAQVVLTTDVSGVLPVANGGTGTTTSLIKVVSYVGNGGGGTAEITVTHNLGVAPAIIYCTTAGNVAGWSWANDGSNNMSTTIQLLADGQKVDNFFSAAPTGTTSFAINTNSGANGNQNSVRYFCFVAAAN